MTSKTDLPIFLTNKKFSPGTIYFRFLIYLKAIYEQKMKEMNFSSLPTELRFWSIFLERCSQRISKILMPKMGNFGGVFQSVDQYTKAEERLQKALTIRREIGDKAGEATDYGNFGSVSQSVGQYTKAEECLQKAPTIRREIGDRKGEASDYGNLGTVFLSVCQYTKAEEYLQKARRSGEKSVTDEEKHQIAEIWELPFFLFVNVSRLKNAFRKH